MVTHRPLAEMEGMSDVGDRAASLDLAQHVGLAIRQRRGARRQRLQRQILIDRAATRGHRAHALGQSLDGRVLHHEARRPRVKSALQVSRSPESRHDEHTHARETCANRLRCRDAIHARHLNVNDGDVGGDRLTRRTVGTSGGHPVGCGRVPGRATGGRWSTSVGRRIRRDGSRLGQARQLLECLRAVGGLRDDLNVTLQIQQPRQRPTNHRLVVSHEHPNRHVAPLSVCT